MARHMKGSTNPQTPAPEASQHTQVRPAGTSQPSTSPSQSPYGAHTSAPDAASDSQSFQIPEKKPHRKWPVVLLLIVIIVAGVLFVGRFVWPDFFNSIPVIGDVFGTQNEQPAEGESAEGEGQEGEGEEGDGYVKPGIPEHPGTITEEQTGSVEASDGATYNMTSDLHSEVRLESVSDEGIVLRFISDPEAGYTTVHVTSCEVNGEAVDPFAEGSPLHFTLHNEYTGDTTETPDPYFIISPVDGSQDSTTVTVRMDGYTAADYASLKLTVDQTFAYGRLSTGEYDVADVNGLYVEVTRA